MSTVQTVGLPVESSDPPGVGQMADRLPCYWHDDIDGTRYLIPGCMARIQDPDVGECTCPTLAAQVASLQRELAAAKHANASLQQWHDQVMRAVQDHPDAKAILFAASKF